MTKTLAALTGQRDNALRKLAADIDSLVTITGVDRMIKAREVNEAAQRLLWAVVGAEVADLIYLQGKGLREIAEKVNEISGETLTHMATKHWLDRFGPYSYWLIREKTGGDGFDTYEHRLRAGGVPKHRQDLAELEEGGYRIIPAAWLIEDPNTELDLAQAWRALGQPTPARDAFAAS